MNQRFPLIVAAGLIGTILLAQPATAGVGRGERLDRVEWSAEGNQAGANLGYSVARAGDVNGDGYGDVIVGAYRFTGGEHWEGEALVYQGSAAGLSLTPSWSAESDQEFSEFGYSVGTAGDVNGDGYDDVIVGAPDYDNGQSDEGRTFVYLGSPSGLSTTPSWTAEGDQVNALFGWSVGTAGDVNGDGFDDVVVGAPSDDNGQANEGRAFAYLGSASGLSFTPGWAAESDQALALFGTSVGTAGDVNGDGFGDVIVGAPLYANGQPEEGRAFVYHGSASGLSTTADWTTEADQGRARFGQSVGTAGDVNGDGYSDVIVGAYRYDHGQVDEGRAFVYQGSATGLSTASSWTGESDQAIAYYGWSLGTAGDIDGDGFDDVIVGAYAYDSGQTNEGRAFVYRGSVTGLRHRARLFEQNQASAFYGWSVGNAGDVNGDGYGSVIIGAPFFDGGQTDEGAAFAT